MAMIEGIRIKNYRTLCDVTLGRLWNSPKETKSLTPLTVVIGKNGVGKSTLFDVFGFIADCLKNGVEEACDAQGRGGFQKVYSQGSKGPIEFEIYYKQSRSERPITYELSIDLDRKKRPYVSSERLRQRRKGQDYGRPYSFLILKNGKGRVWVGREGYCDDALNEDPDLADILGFDRDKENPESIPVELTDQRSLGIVTLAALKEHPRITKFRKFLGKWYLSYFKPSSARDLPLAGPQKHLDVEGNNIGNVVQFMERKHSDLFEKILVNIAGKIPGINTISTERTSDGRLLLRFNDRGFSEPFYAQQMSDGTLKVFAYLLLMNDPEPPPFICIEEPENGLYHKLLEILTLEFREHATANKGGTQVFMTTHQPYLLNALNPDEVWILEKGEDGFATVRRGNKDPLIQNLVDEEIPLGGLWSSGYLEVK